MLTRSREKWKERVAAEGREIRRLRVKVGDLEVGRTSWKRRALAQAVPPLPPEDLGLGKAPAKSPLSWRPCRCWARSTTPPRSPRRRGGHRVFDQLAGICGWLAVTGRRKSRYLPGDDPPLAPSPGLLPAAAAGGAARRLGSCSSTTPWSWARHAVLLVLGMPLGQWRRQGRGVDRFRRAGADGGGGGTLHWRGGTPAAPALGASADCRRCRPRSSATTAATWPRGSSCGARTQADVVDTSDVSHKLACLLKAELEPDPPGLAGVPPPGGAEPCVAATSPGGAAAAAGVADQGRVLRTWKG